MPPKYQHFRTSVPGRLPPPSEMAEAEIAINLADKKLFFKDAAGNIVPLGGETYTKDQMDAKFLMQGVLPFSRFGDLTDTALPISSTGLTLTTLADIPLVLSGRTYTMPNNSTIVLAANAVQYVHVTLVGGKAVFVVYNSRQPESTASMFIGVVFTGSSSVTKNNISKVSRLDLYRPSQSVQGSAFAVSAGNPNVTGSRNW